MTDLSTQAIELAAATCRASGACCSFSREWPRFSLENDADLDQIPRGYVDDEHGRMRCSGDRCTWVWCPNRSPPATAPSSARYRRGKPIFACAVRAGRLGGAIKLQSWERHGLKRWLDAAKQRLHRNVLAIALANKLARIAWSVLVRGRAFAASKLQAA